MKKNYFFLVLSGIICIAGIDAHAQYCIPPESTFGGPMTGFENVSVGTLNNTSAHDGYTNYTGTVATVNMARGASYTPSFILYHEILNNGFSDMLNLRIWIDYNADGDFNDSGEEVLSQTSPQLLTASGTSFTGSAFVIPVGATLGVTRMRVFSDMLVSDGHDTPIPCGYLTSSNTLGQHGETEDYSVTITTPSAINSLENDTDLNIYPNPTNNLITLNFANKTPSEIIAITIYSIDGSLVKSLPSVQTKELLTIDLSNLESGQYFLKINSNSSVITKKITVIK
ncbi:MAG: hypothetical protein A3K10_01440 [Bacteroidetes bacterium RIFCSPLOWO2_12_FULL_31_6]|nr:MAG: hypothetical protein A3K10_01440 [Bacteroidetes bacterium RIFCSPLOWO2_12_FULL_31_6]